MLDRFFGLSRHGTNVRRELLAGLTTFLTMAYIIFVQPAVLSVTRGGQPSGMDFGAVTTATCLSAALATAIMALVRALPDRPSPGHGRKLLLHAHGHSGRCRDDCRRRQVGDHARGRNRSLADRPGRGVHLGRPLPPVDARRTAADPPRYDHARACGTPLPRGSDCSSRSSA